LRRLPIGCSMPKNRHHFVPRFYLGGFESAPKRINILGVDTPRRVKDGSLRDQCYRHKFYGPSDQIEDALGVLESHAAAVFQRIEANGSLPSAGSEEHWTLLAFVALQLIRTAVVANRVNVHVDKTTKQAYSHDPRISEEDLENMKIGYEDPVLISLANLPVMLDAICDLNAHLIVSSDAAFITSDNPAFKYNQYCEDIDYQGTTGAICSGFQVFLPLTPRHQLLLYDASIYNVRRADRRSRRSIALQADVDALNSIQLVSAGENVYFSEWSRVDSLAALLAQAHERRAIDPVVVQEYGHDQEPNRSLLHSFVRTPCLKLNLSFLKIRWRARSVALQDRARRYRKDMPLPPIPEPPPQYRGPATFSRLIGRR
jgi:hypothetical protein